jgi:hypothetical protein
VCDLSAESSVVHEEDIEVLRIVNHKFLESVGKEELGSVIGSVTDFGHLLVASESSSHAVVDT